MTHFVCDCSVKVYESKMICKIFTRWSSSLLGVQLFLQLLETFPPACLYFVAFLLLVKENSLLPEYDTQIHSDCDRYDLYGAQQDYQPQRDFLSLGDTNRLGSASFQARLRERVPVARVAVNSVGGAQLALAHAFAIASVNETARALLRVRKALVFA